jgi:hypothetical protein
MSEQLMVTQGMHVRTFDGSGLGTVEAYEPGRILVRNRWHRAYWMPDGLVRSINKDCATLHIDRRVVPRYRQPAGPATARRHATRAGFRLATVCGLLAGLVVSLVGLL